MSAVEDNFSARCEECGVALTRQEIEDAREAGRPFLCSVHIAEDLPEVAEEAEPPDAA
jgi:hypothetical protein